MPTTIELNIALANIFSRLLEHVILNRNEVSLTTSDHYSLASNLQTFNGSVYIFF